MVIGAGIVGLMAARALRAEGRQVLVLDRSGPASGASAGNAGILAFPEILPLASPGILRKAPRWLADPLGPLAIRPAYALRIAPWLLRFAAASRPRVEAVAEARARRAETAPASRAETRAMASVSVHVGVMRTASRRRPTTLRVSGRRCRAPSVRAWTRRDAGRG